MNNTPKTLDRLTGVPKTISEIHSITNQGNMFVASEYDLNSSFPKYYILEPEVPIHYVLSEMEIDSGIVKVALYEGVEQDGEDIENNILVSALNRVNVKRPRMGFKEVAGLDTGNAEKLREIVLRTEEGVGGREVPFRAFETLKRILNPEYKYGLEIIQSSGTTEFMEMELVWFHYG